MNALHLAGLLDGAAARYGDRLCLIGERTLTYAEAASSTRRLARWLERRGVRHGDRAVILTRNRVEVAEAAFAVARIGAAFAVLHNSIREPGLERILTQMTPAVAFIDETTAHLAGSLGGAIKVWVSASPAPPGTAALDAILREEEEEHGAFPGIDLDPVCIVYTSGSTGAPRGVTLSHDNILFVIDAIQERLGYACSDVIGVFLPLSFDYGLYQIFLAFQVGAAVFIGGAELAGPPLLSTLEERRISVLPGVPTLFAGLLKMWSRQPRPLAGLRILTNTGAHLPQAHVEQLRRSFPAASLFPMYGLTECKRVSILRPEEIEAKPGSVGRPLAGTRAFLVDASGRRVGPGEVGELVIEGRHVALGYWGAEEETALRYRPHPRGLGRVLYSGDLFRMDQDGYLYFVGRRDFLIKRRGFRMHPVEIEEAACAIAGLAEAGVAQESDGGERLHLFVTLHDPALSQASILENLFARLEPHKLPDAVWILKELPKTGNGKLDREVLARLTRGAACEAGGGAPGAGTTMGEADG